VFQFLSLLHSSCPQKYIFDEIKTIEDNEFRFQEPVSSLIKTLLHCLFKDLLHCSFTDCSSNSISH